LDELGVPVVPSSERVRRPLSLVPLAAIIGRATEELAARAGPRLGGLLNATFGNAAELIIAGLADVGKRLLFPLIGPEAFADWSQWAIGEIGPMLAEGFARCARARGIDAEVTY
jgi:hypothetical protein